MPLLIKNILNKIKTFEEKIKDTGWINLTVLDNWIQYSGQNSLQYKKKAGIVYLHGIVRTSGGTATGSRNISQLPAGFVPNGTTNNLYFSTISVHDNQRNPQHVQISKAGMIIGPANLEANDWISLDGLSFPVE